MNHNCPPKRSIRVGMEFAYPSHFTVLYNVKMPVHKYCLFLLSLLFLVKWFPPQFIICQTFLCGTPHQSVVILTWFTYQRETANLYSIQVSFNHCNFCFGFVLHVMAVVCLQHFTISSIHIIWVYIWIVPTVINIILMDIQGNC